MAFWNWFGGLFSNQVEPVASSDSGCEVNPATGLPMIGGCGSVDVAGNPFGVDLHADDSLLQHSG